MKIKITLVGGKYHVEVPGRITKILTRDSLKWNLKKVFLFDGAAVLSVMVACETFGSFEFDPYETYDKKAA